MAHHSIRINYTLYSPNYERATGLCLDFDTLERAKRRARDLGSGTIFVRNFDRTNKYGTIDWWQAERFWLFDGAEFKKVLPDPDSTKWQSSTQSSVTDLRNTLRRRS